MSFNTKCCGSKAESAFRWLFFHGIEKLGAVRLWFQTCFGIILLLVLALAGTQAMAQTEPNLDAAIEAWLEDRDDVAIPMLAKLAAGGNESAMLLLGQIARRPYSFSEFLDKKSVKERNALLKAPGGLSGTTWLKQVETEKPLAEALLGIDDPGNRSTHTRLLLDRGEKGQAIRQLLRQLDHSESPGLFELADNPDFPEEVRFVPWTIAAVYPWNATKDQLRQHLTSGLEALESQELQGFVFARMSKGPLEERFGLGDFVSEHDADLGALLLSGQFRQPAGTIADNLTDSHKVRLREEALEVIAGTKEVWALLDLCDQHCSGEAGDCFWAAYFGIGGLLGALGVQSPVEKLIPSARYVSSPRYRADLVRRIKANKRTLDGDVRLPDMCASDMVRKLAQ